MIFNGTAARKAAGFAEVKLSFDDFQPPPGSLLDSGSGATVSVARRLYRSGESEYLINGTLARLKDIRELFLDTGANIDAYSVIEQGKVETFLQASSEDRRLVFDEAAGISRYKARRREAQRRLERVEQNLLRLGDVLGEVQKRLRSIKYQAGKARSYQQYAAELKELRALFALAEYHRLLQQRRLLQEQVGHLRDQLTQLGGQLERLESARSASEAEAAELEQAARAIDARIAAAVSQLAAAQQRIEMMTTRAAELAQNVAADAGRAEQLEAKAAQTRQEAAELEDQLQQLSSGMSQLEQEQQQLQARHQQANQTVLELRQQLDDEKNGTIDLLRRTAQLHNEAAGHSIRRENLDNQRTRLTGRAQEVAAQLAALLQRRSELQTRLENIRGVIVESQQRLDQAHADQKQLQQADAAQAGELSQAQQEHSALLSRQNVLEEMQNRLEGVGEGSKRLLAAQGQLPFIGGLLGQYIESDLEHASLVEAALGGADQWLLAQSLQAVTGQADRIRQLLGEKASVQIVCLDQLPDLAAATVAVTTEPAAAPGGSDNPDTSSAPLEEQPVPAALPAYRRACELVRCSDAGAAQAVQAILGNTLVVQDLAAALACRVSGALGSARFVTRGGELLEADGRVRMGAGGLATGVIWRRSELAQLAHKLLQSQAQIDQAVSRQQEIHFQQNHLAALVGQLRTAIYEASTERVEAQTNLQSADAEKARLQREAPLLEQEAGLLAAQIDSALQQEQQAKWQLSQLEERQRQQESEVARLGELVSQSAQQQEAISAQLTAARVALAESRERRTGLGESLTRLKSAATAIDGEVVQLREHMQQCRQRQAESEEAAKGAQDQAQTLQASKLELDKEAADVAESRRSVEQRLAEIRQTLADERRRQGGLSDQLNAAQLQLGEADVRVETIISRTQEELGLDVPAAYASYRHDEGRDWEAVKNQIAELRGRIERLGNVNLDAIGEQDELQKREEFLAKQVDDVKSSQSQLTELIRKINAESRQRFEESFNAVRGHFNDLFRKLFGGGKADILLENPQDLLESGIEIVARPPGKELRSISLMSGGEKTMTALALLFSFFKSRPSPFCVLDEVDAALDEANTQRFVLLVREFLQGSQFIIISHSKRTIAMADQIYGVTMQELGCSTKISVRFEEAQKLAQQQSVGAG